VDNSQDAIDADSGGRKRRRRPSCGVIVLILLVLAAGGGATGYLAGTFALRQEVPTPIEATLADVAVRTLMVDPSYSDKRIPETALTSESLAAGKELFAVQCSLCHGNGGKGDGDFGKTMFPPAADLTASRTKSKSEGQLFWLIWHGVNYTGMPAFGQSPAGAPGPGGGNSDQDIWKLVAHIRSLQGELRTPVATR
jgi:mono/diheme cytochrome c family protein